MLFAGCLGVTAVVAQPTFLTDEVQVDVDSRSRPRDPVAVELSNGGSLIVWQEDRHGVFGRLLDSAGAPVGGDLALAPSTTATAPFSGRLRLRKAPAAAALANGDVLLAWTEEHQFVRSAPFFERRLLLGSAVYARVFSPGAEEPLGPPVRLSSSRGGIQREPELTVLSDGRVFAGWSFEQGETSGLRATVLGTDGRPTGPALEIDAGSDLKAGGLSLTAHPSGGVLATWHACCDGGGDLGVFASVIHVAADAAGAEAGPVLRLNGVEENQQSRPAATVLTTGEYLVAWQSSTGVPEPIYDGWRVRGQRVSEDGSLLGSEMQLSDGYGWGHTRPSLSVGADGRALVAWLAWSGDFPAAVLARQLDADGRTAGEPFFVSAEWAIGSPSTVSLDAERTLMTWVSIIDRRGISVRVLGDAE